MLWPVLMAALTAEPLVLEDAVRPAPLAIPPKESRELLLPALPAREGQVLLLRFRAYVHTSSEGGCNYNGALRLNGNPVGRFTAGGTERMLGRPPMFELAADTTERTFPVFNGPLLMVMFAPTADRAEAMTRDDQGATFLLDISDLARGVDGNVLWFQNRLEQPTRNATGELRIEDIELGWVARERLPKPVRRAPERTPMAAMVEQAGLRLAQGRGGGFSFAALGEELLVETAIAMASDAPSELTADDAAPGPQVTIAPWGPSGFELQARWPGIELRRWLELRDGGLAWRERWTNRGDAVRGVPFNHRLFLRQGEPRIRVGGSLDVTAVASSPTNPTLFFETLGKGLGVTAESDQLRLLMGLRAQADVAEAYSHWLALAPGSSIDFAWTITPVADGGYWSFINGLRKRWGISGTMDRPLFWGYARKPGVADPTDQLRESLGHLGPLYVTVSPWQRLEPDAKVVRAGGYPKLPADAPRTTGPAADLDVEAFLSYAHRERYWQQFALDLARLREAAPEARPLAMTHPAMEAVYKPLQSRWPIAGEVIRTADGEPFEDGGYSRAWLGDATNQGWGVLYHVPRPGSAYLAEILAGIDRAMTSCGAAGIYCDEFSWGLNTRGYSRYDYGRWDGFSADLSPAAEVLRLKCDNAWLTESAQLQMATAAAVRGGFFLGNGGNVLRSLIRLPLHRFVEGGNGPAWMYYGHLSPVPLVLGNFGDQSTRAGVFEAVKSCLSNGSVYSPMAVNLLLEGRDNFVSKQYPLTVTELGPGWVAGEERLITTVARPLPWPGPVKLYRYDSTGGLMATEGLAQPALVEVPPGGLAIAERLPAGSEG